MKGEGIFWVAECSYDGYNEFHFFSSMFSWDWKDGDILTQAQLTVNEEWAKLSPHPAPTVRRVHPGFLGFYRQEKPK